MLVRLRGIRRTKIIVGEKQMGKFVEVHGYKNFVYCYGQGSITLVLLSGSGVPFPSLEYKTLANALAKTYQVIGIEKLGYGRSDLTENNRDIDVVVHEYRSVLQKLGINSPIVLVAHSMGFLEALRWGQQYPFEIAGILGVDPATPDCYREFDVEGATKKLKEMSADVVCRKTTASALVEQFLKEQKISEKEKNEIEDLAFRNLANQNWISEAENLRNAIGLVEQNNPYLQIPMLFFLSNGEGTTLKKESWIKYALQYLDKIRGSQYELFDFPHNLYKFVYQEIAQLSRNFISKHIE